MGSLLGYARVSTVEQNAALQVDEPTGGWSLRFSPTTPRGVLDRRPELDAVLAQLRPGDTPGGAAVGLPRPLVAAFDRHHLHGAGGGWETGRPG